MTWKHLVLPPEVKALFDASPRVEFVGSTDRLVELACPTESAGQWEVAYEVPGKGRVVEATVVRARNGIAANYPEAYMRRRDPDCMLIADDRPTDKPRYAEAAQAPFDELRRDTFKWLGEQELLAFAFTAGREGLGAGALVVLPLNAAFFGLGLALLQGIVRTEKLDESFSIGAVIYVAPPFRHTHFAGKQMVVHNRTEAVHEMFAYNLYPGPSAKKGVYGVLLGIGEREGWVTNHCSTVQVVTPYDNVVTIMHEGASGGGKSEMLEYAHREEDGRLILGRNVVTGERRHLEIPRGCELRPVTDDMALCHPSIQTDNGKLSVTDAENAWFVRVNHIERYGTDLRLERITAQPHQPLLFLNIDAAPNSRALIWEHTLDAPGKPCPNPRVVLPRNEVPDVVDGPVTVDIRSFGIRTPPCTREQPSYGIIGLFHILPPALAWLWRLVAPRGYANPSIVDAEGMTSEGVGSYWPFATGREVDHANLLLEQFVRTPRTRHILTPNQHIGAWYMGFMPQWIAREYLARRGSARFRPDQIQPARCPLLGHALFQLQVEGRFIPRWFLQVHTQPEVGDEAYNRGAEILQDFFRQQLERFLIPDLNPLGREIIECCLRRGSVDEYEGFIPQR